jgi:tetratricopeptide (TPR) repeat protein
MRVGICLNMIVKNESKNMKRLFDSLHEYIDYFVISDTGSNDNTIEIISELSSFYKIPGKVVNHDWVDFAHNRNQALQSAINAKTAGLHNCSWLMIIDADEELKVINNLWINELKPGFSYSTYKKIGSTSFRHFFLLWIDGQEWNWKGQVHNYITNNNHSHLKLFTHELYIRCHQSEGAKSHRFKNDLEKTQYDIEQLLEELSSEKLNEDNVLRYFQLAYSYRDANELLKATDFLKQIIDYEHTSISIKYVSAYLIAKYLLILNATNEEIESYLKKAIALNQNRKEAYFYLAVYKRKNSDLILALTILEKANVLPLSNEDNIMIEDDIYLWKIKYELAFVYFLLDQYKESTDIIEQIKKEGYLPVIEMSFLDSLILKMR